MGNPAAVGLGVLAHPAFNAKVFGANDRLVMGIIGAGGMGRGHMENFKDQGVEWGAVLECVRSRTQPNAPVEIGHQAVRTLHLANLAQRKKARAVLGEDGKTVSV